MHFSNILGKYRRSLLHSLFPMILLVLCMLLAGCGKQTKSFQSLDDFDQKGNSYGVVTGSGSMFLAEEYFKNATEKQYDSLEDCLQAVRSGKVDGFVYDINIIKYYRNVDPDTLVILGEELPEKKDIGVAISRVTKIPALQKQVNAFLDELRSDGTLDDMFDRWVNQGNETMPEIPEPSSPEGTITAGVLGTMPPFNYVKNGKLTGFDLELLKRFALYMNMKVVVRTETAASMVSDLETGTVDIMSSNVTMSKERREVVDFSEPMYSSYSAVLMLNPNHATNKVTFSGIADSFNKTLLRENRWLLLLKGLGLTLLISLGAVVLGTVEGFLLCILGRSKNNVLHGFVDGLCTLMNGIPMLVTLMIFFYVILNGTGLPGMVVAIIAFALDFAVHLRGILDTGIASVSVGEVEAAMAIGMSARQAFMKVILPQAVRNIMSLYEGLIVTLVKATSIVGYVAIQDLTKASDIIRATTFEAFFPLITSAILYFLLSGLMVLGIRILWKVLFPERKVRTHV